jgi:Saxitoxin biosynthesis operon protein SxtJ
MNASRAMLRSFGLTVGGITALLGGWWIYRGKFVSIAPISVGLGGLLLLLGLAAPAALRVPHRLWMGLGEALGFVMSRLVLAIVFFLVVTPIGFIRRRLGADPLRRRAASAETYWEDYPVSRQDRRHYKKMY